MHDARQRTWGAPTYLPSACSNRATFGPVPIQPLRSESTTSAISASPIVGLPKTRKSRSTRHASGLGHPESLVRRLERLFALPLREHVAQALLDRLGRVLPGMPARVIETRLATARRAAPGRRAGARSLPRRPGRRSRPARSGRPRRALPRCRSRVRRPRAGRRRACPSARATSSSSRRRRPPSPRSTPTRGGWGSRSRGARTESLSRVARRRRRRRRAGQDGGASRAPSAIRPRATARRWVTSRPYKTTVSARRSTGRTRYSSSMP